MHHKVFPPLLVFVLASASVVAQSPKPYPHAISDQSVHSKTDMLPPPVNVRFTDPDFGSSMTRVTDENSDPLASGVSFQAVEAGKDEWNVDETKFYVNGGEGRVFAFGFDPHSMAIKSLGGMKPGKGLVIPLTPGPTFSRVNPDLMYGTTYGAPLTISSYRFSTNTVTPVIDTTTCKTVPALVPGRGVISDFDVNVSNGDNRLSISEGGNEYGAHTFAIVYDKHRGCRWYNTETGEIGGEWGASGMASTPDRYLIRHATLSKSGRYLRIARNVGFYVWDLETLKVTACAVPDGPHCAGYAVNGYNHMAGGAGYIDDWNIVKRPLNELTELTPLVFPLTRGLWGQVKHFTWNNADAQDTAPLCGSAFTYYTGDMIKRPYDGEIFCMKTDGLTSTVWRFAHHRSDADPDVFHTVPKVSVSRSGRFLLFNSNWDNQVGFLPSGEPRADVWIVKLD